VTSLLTISEAATALNLSGQRVHQLLQIGALEDTALPSGRLRHPPNAPRITESSVRALVGVRTSGKTVLPPRERKGNPEVIASSTHELKVRADMLREQLRGERERSRRLVEIVETLAGLLREAHDSADRLDAVAETYSDVLTQFLAPDTLQE